jgi:hypothetical protein
MNYGKRYRIKTGIDKENTMELLRTITQYEKDQLGVAELKLQELGVDTDNPDYVKPIVTYLNQNLNQVGFTITADAIVTFVKTNPTQFTWRSAVQQEYDKLAVKFSEHEKNLIARSLQAHGYWESEDIATDQDLLHWNLTAKAHLARYPGQSVTSDNLRITIGHLLNSPQGSKFIKKVAPSKFNAQAAVKAQEEARKTFKRNEDELIQEDTTGVRPLSGVLKAHRDMLHGKSQQITPEPENTDKLYDRKLEDLLNSVQSNVIREEARQLSRKLQFGGSKPKETFEQVSLWLERRLNTRRLAGWIS